MNRVRFLVDGFNGYHSLLNAREDLKGDFSALAFHIDQRKPGITLRHRNYIDCLESTGVQVELGRFKSKYVHYRDAADTVVLVTGDTDLAPAVRLASQLFKTKEVAFAFPYKRKNKELMMLVTSATVPPADPAPRPASGAVSRMR